jgi:hypothetical protein
MTTSPAAATTQSPTTRTATHNENVSETGNVHR